ncbi:hypothetical protein QBC46DRAFT_348998 [Diplogelasinospora grovesii]|uniref:Uncharacterized protein n=1 Tax=Diplogelasinospora grovesii TaxID=303347 RepID=A0AAN6NKB6_9PEZI|nr:hypothetical protein QBC46DRAFT_348998 [Diplogelasinospora grovesii]
MASLKHLLLLRFLFLLLICSSCAWAATQHQHYQPQPRGGVGGDGDNGVEEPLVERKHNNILRGPAATATPQQQPNHVALEGCAITPPPLWIRQDSGQIQALSDQLQQVSDQFRSVSQASQQVSQSSQQLSQSLQQASQRLSQTQQSLASMSVGSSAASQAAQSFSQQAQQLSRSLDAASSSADSAVASASSSASAAIAAQMASVTGSVASALAQASISAQSIMKSAASMVQQAQADATAVRNEANNQVQQAQGAAVSVTQAALAIVGGIIGSSLLTIAAFVCVLRYKKNRQEKRRTRLLAERGDMGVSYPAPNLNNEKGLSGAGGGRVQSYGSSVYDNNNNSNYGGYQGDIKQPLPAAQQQLGRSDSASSTASSTRGLVGGGGGIGVALGGYGQGSRGVGTTTVISATNRNGSTGKPGGFQLQDPPPPRAGKFSLFPQQNAGDEKTAGSTELNRASKMSTPPSLDTWLRAGTVSPFATLKKDANNNGPTGER